jgi:predicted nucleic acid-binding protein
VTFVVLDTDVVSRMLKQTLPPSLMRQLVGLSPCVTFVTVAELEQWTVLKSWGPARRSQMDRWLDGVPHLGYDDDVSRTWGRLYAGAVRRGRTRPANDTWNAACALVEGLPFATLNVKDYVDFAEHDGLRLIVAD